MTSRERVLAAINHKQPDYVPLDLGATPSSGISAIAYNNLKKHLGMTGGQTRIFDVVQQVVVPEKEIIDKFGVDVIDIGRVFNEKDEDWHETVLADGSIGHYPNWFNPEKQPNGDYLVHDSEGTLIARMPVGATFFDPTYFPYVDDYPDDYSDLDHQMGKVLWSALVHSPWDHAGDKDFYKTLREKTLKLRESTDKHRFLCRRSGRSNQRHLRKTSNRLPDKIKCPVRAGGNYGGIINVGIKAYK